MLARLPQIVAAPLAYLIYLAHTAIWIGPLLLVAPCKFLSSRPGWRHGVDRLLFALGRGWMAGCNHLTALLYRIDWQIEGARPLDPQGWYLVVANHQSWLDLIVFLRVFGHEMPFPRIFAKREILWLPFIGPAVWALDFPLVKRYPKELLERRPQLRGVDLAITRRACCRAAELPGTIVNFLEGTRFTPEKQRRQESPYRYLLRPKAGGAALAVAVLGERLTALLDLSIAYPAGRPNFWQFLAGRVPRIVVRLREIPVPAHLSGGDYENDAATRAAYQEWVGQLWVEKDIWLHAQLQEREAA
jgi:1-acyl-sn-glycerol-3-phosphate acyltransferase